MKIDIICRGKLSRLVEDILEVDGHEFEFFDDTTDEYKNTQDSVGENIFIANGDPTVRRNYYSFYKNKNYVSAISKTAIISKTAKISPASVFNHYTSIGALADLGFSCLVHTHTNIDVGTKMGDFCRVGSKVHIAEYVTIGDNCIIGSGVVITPRVSIGNNCTILAGSIVTHSFGDNQVIGGFPARSLKSNIG